MLKTYNLPCPSVFRPHTRVMKTRLRLGLAVCASCLILVWTIAPGDREDTIPDRTAGVNSRTQPRVSRNLDFRHFTKHVAEEESASISQGNQNITSSALHVPSERPMLPRQLNSVRSKAPFAGGAEDSEEIRQLSDTMRSKHRTTGSPTSPECRSNDQAKRKSRWFTSRVNKDVPVFLNMVNSYVTGSARQWWINNRPQKDTGLESAIANLLAVAPGKYSIRSSACLTCAIVGNAGNLRGSGYGKLIDSQDLVIRSNTSPIEGYEEDVGTRTTHQILYPESSRDYHLGAVILFLPFKVLDLRWLASIFTSKNVTQGFWRDVPASLEGAKPEEVYVIHPAFLHHVYNIWLSSPSNKWPSAGSVALSLGLHMCDELHVVGFGMNKYGHWDHYYDDKVGQDTTRKAKLHHSVEQEGTVRKQLHADGILNVYPGKTL